MRVAWAGVVALVAAVTATGCRDNSPDGTATAAPAPAGTGPVGFVPAYVTGTWRSTSATVVPGPTAREMTGPLAGGRGVVLTIGGNGAAKVDFASMQPMTFAVDSDAGTVAGQYSYSGTATGTLRFPAGAGPTPTGNAVQTGAWQPSGDVGRAAIHAQADRAARPDHCGQCQDPCCHGQPDQPGERRGGSPAGATGGQIQLRRRDADDPIAAGTDSHLGVPAGMT